MKRLLLWLLIAVFALSCASSLAETVLDGRDERGIVPQEAGLNQPGEDESPTTGRSLSSLSAPSGFSGLAVNGRYMPMLVQIDNTDNGAGVRAPWGAQYADIVYESPLRREGHTRISLLFSDLIPDDVGPVRSARLGHVWLREEWDCGFMFYGQQELAKTNVLEEFTRLGATQKGVLFSGTSGGKNWKRYYYARKGLKSPHNRGGDAAAIQGLIPADFTAPNHAFRFTDTPAQGDPAFSVRVDWGLADYLSEFRYDEEKGIYRRIIRSGRNSTEVYHDADTENAITFANVIVQWVDVDWVQNTAPVMRNTGDAFFFTAYGDGSFIAHGNADYFMNGVHVAGCWKRDGMTSRTVFYGPDGEEISLQRGRTMIVMLPCVERQIHTNSANKPTPLDIVRFVRYD